MVARDKAACLQGGADDSGLVVNLRPRDVAVTAFGPHRLADETDTGLLVDRADQPFDDRAVLDGSRTHEPEP